MLFSTLTVLATSLFAVLSASTPVPAAIVSRAGAPLAKPIPANCSVTNPLADGRGDRGSSCWQPRTSTRAGQIYAYYLPPSTLEYRNRTDIWTQCLEQCYGYGYTGDCQAAFMAENVPSVPVYTAPGGDPSIACLMYNRPLTRADFERPAARGQYVNAQVGDISCPA